VAESGETGVVVWPIPNEENINKSKIEEMSFMALNNNGTNILLCMFILLKKLFVKRSK
jgi:hypothetical protein